MYKKEAGAGEKIIFHFTMDICIMIKIILMFLVTSATKRKSNADKFH